MAADFTIRRKSGSLMVVFYARWRAGYIHFAISRIYEV